MNKEELKKKNAKHKSLPHYMTSTTKNTNVVGVVKIASIDYKDNKSKPPPPSPSKPPIHKPSLSPHKPESTPTIVRVRPKSLCLSSNTSLVKPSPKTPKGTINPYNITQSTKHPSVHVTNFKDPKLKKESLTPTPKPTKSAKIPKAKHMSMSFDAAALQKAREYEEKYSKSIVEPSPKSDQQNNESKPHTHHHHHHSSSNNSNKEINNINLESSCSSSSNSSSLNQSQRSNQHSYHHQHHQHHQHSSSDYFNNDDTPPPPIDDIFEYSLPAFTIPSKIPKINSVPSSTSPSSSSITSSNNSYTNINNSNNESTTKSSDSEINYFSIPTLIDTPPSMIPDDLLDVPTLPPPPKYNMSDSYYLPPPSAASILHSQQQQQQQQKQELLQPQEVEEGEVSYYEPQQISQIQQQDQQQQQQYAEQTNQQEYYEVSQINREKTERELYEELRNEIYSNKIKSKKSSEITEDLSFYHCYITQIIILQRWYRELRKRHQDFYNEINRQPFALDGDHSYEDKNEKLKEETFSPSADDEFFNALNEGIVF